MDKNPELGTEDLDPYHRTEDTDLDLLTEYPLPLGFGSLFRWPLIYATFLCSPLDIHVIWVTYKEELELFIPFIQILCMCVESEPCIRARFRIHTFRFDRATLTWCGNNVGDKPNHSLFRQAWFDFWSDLNRGKKCRSRNRTGEYSLKMHRKMIGIRVGN